MKEKISKKEGRENIEKFFENIKEKSPKEIKKIKKLSANKKIPLEDYKKLFCKKCLNPFIGLEKIRIKKGFKTIKCKNCGKIKKVKL